jgi:hypothetical protein
VLSCPDLRARLSPGAVRLLTTPAAAQNGNFVDDVHENITLPGLRGETLRGTQHVLQDVRPQLSGTQVVQQFACPAEEGGDLVHDDLLDLTGGDAEGW